MDWNKKLSNVKRELNRQSSKFQDAETQEEQEGALNRYQNGLNFINQILKGTVPSLYRDHFTNLKQMAEQEVSQMKKGLGTFNQKAMVAEGGGPQGKSKSKGGDDDSKLADGLMATIVGEKPNVKWEDVAGLVEAKKSLHEALIMPIKFPAFFVGNVKPWRGILLYGPPGTGKTFIAKACATECQSTFFSVSSSDLMSKFVGESEKLIKQLFKLANEKAPSIIFIDEIDSMCGDRSEGENEASRRVKTEFLVQMQGVGHDNNNVLVLGATNLPWSLDKAVRRRFERRIYIPLPDKIARSYLLRSKLKGLDENLTDEDIDAIADKTDGYSGSDIEVLCKDAAMMPLRHAQHATYFKPVNTPQGPKFMPTNSPGPGVKNCSVYELPDRSLKLAELTREDLFEATKKAKPSVNSSDLKEYEDWTEQFGIQD
jgi:vacuolar protein-sorting-associated protein 4